MEPLYIVLAVFGIAVALILCLVIVAIIFDLKGISILGLIAERREKRAAKKAPKKKSKAKSPSRSIFKEDTEPVVRKEVSKPAPEPAPEPEPQPEPEPEPAPEPVKPEVVAIKEVHSEDGEELTRVAEVIENGKRQYIVIRYSKSFLAKLIQADDETKAHYSELKNLLLSYKGVKNRVSWKKETFHSGRTLLAKLRMRGKTLALELPLNPADYNDTKYHIEDISDVKSSVDAPCMYRMKNERRVKYAHELIAQIMDKHGLVLNEKAEKTDYASQHPYETIDALLDKKLIKEIKHKETKEEVKSEPVIETRKSVTVAEADTLIKDEVAVALVEKADKSLQRKTDKTKVGIVNIDTLSHHFKDGETVTLEEIKKRIPEVSKKTTYIKVLARGTLDKSLTVHADHFSIQAVKMIVLTGGKAIKN